jgi:hypothetical protein
MTTELENNPVAITEQETAVLTISLKLFIHWQELADLPDDFSSHYQINYGGDNYLFKDYQEGNQDILIFASGNNRIGINRPLKLIHKWLLSGWFPG